MIFSKAIIEAGKELARVVLLAIIPVLMVGININTGELDFNLQLTLAVGLLALLRAVDKWLHETGKETDNDILARGLTQF